MAAYLNRTAIDKLGESLAALTALKKRWGVGWGGAAAVCFVMRIGPRLRFLVNSLPYSALPLRLSLPAAAGWATITRR